MKGVLVAVVVLAAAFTAAAQADPPAGFYESRLLEPAASFVAGKPVKVWCATSQYDWLRFLTATGRTEANGSAVPGSAELKLSPVVCQNLRLKLARKAVRAAVLGPSLLTLVHESIHDRGTVDEGQTDCNAVHEMPRVAVKFFNVKSGKDLRTVMAATWAYRAKSPAAYRTVC